MMTMMWMMMMMMMMPITFIQRVAAHSSAMHPVASHSPLHLEADPAAVVTV